jgi:protein TonB
MMRRWRMAAATDPRLVLWLTSAAVHAAVAAVVLTRTPYGIADRADAHLATAPQVELGQLPLPATGENQETAAIAEPEPAAVREQEPPPVPEPMETAALATPPPEPPVPAAAEDAVPAATPDEPPPQAKPAKPSTHKPSPEPRERKVRTSHREHASDRATAVTPRASGTMAGAHAEHAQTGAAEANYGILLRAEIMRRRIYPADAISRGDEGTVTARVTIGPNGTAVSHSVIRGSGITAFDRAVPQIMARLSLPPPPGGRYTATVAIRFALD